MLFFSHDQLVLWVDVTFSHKNLMFVTEKLLVIKKKKNIYIYI